MVVTRNMEDKINTFATFCYRVMLINIKRVDRISIEAIYNMTKTIPLITRVRTQQLKFLGHVLHLHDDEPVKEYALYVPPHGKRKPGRPRTLYLNYVQDLLGDSDGMLQPNNFSSLAKIAAVGEILWSPAPQPNDDDVVFM